MPLKSVIKLYVNTYSKTLVNIGGSTILVPSLYYGDQPTFAVFPVIPINDNPLLGYTSVDLTGMSGRITMAGQPNANSPPTPFASLDGIAWNGSLNCFIGTVDMTQPAVKAFLASAIFQTAYFNVDFFDVALERNTLFQSTFQLGASIDQVTAAPPSGAVVYPTLAQLLNIFVPVAATPGKRIEFQSDDGTIKESFGLRDDGTYGGTTIS